jgi:hypothetical protein
MTGGWRDYPVVERAHYGAVRARAWSRRATRSAMAVRAGVFVSGLGALLLALPPPARPGPAVLAAALLAYLAAAWPSGLWVPMLELGAVTAFLGGLAVGAHPARLPEVALLATLLYLHHSAAALGAVLRTDAVVPAAVLRRWVGRAAVVLAASAGTGLCVVAFALAAPPDWSATVFVGLGALAAVGVTAALALPGRR